jgi:hypothetical protein
MAPKFKCDVCGDDAVAMIETEPLCQVCMVATLAEDGSCAVAELPKVCPVCEGEGCDGPAEHEGTE